LVVGGAGGAGGGDFHPRTCRPAIFASIIGPSDFVHAQALRAAAAEPPHAPAHAVMRLDRLRAAHHLLFMRSPGEKA
jgi:hypothetical protein